MYASILESARNSTIRNPFVTTVNCDPAENATTQNLVAGRTIAAASVAEGGSNKLTLSSFFFFIKWEKLIDLSLFCFVIYFE